MKIAVAFFGLPRCSRLTFPSIEREVLSRFPQEAEVKCFFHLYQQDSVHNVRSGESGVLAPENYDPFKGMNGELQTPDSFLGGSDLAALKVYGDTWKDEFKSLQNLLMQLNSLKCVTRKVQSWGPDIVVYLRPDLLYHSPLPDWSFNYCYENPKAIFVPGWQWGKGLNDRFAICGNQTYLVYGNRIDQCIEYCKTMRDSLHAERFLKYVLQKNQLKILLMMSRASRVRINGDVRDEDFKQKMSLLSPLTNKYKRFYFLIQLRTWFASKRAGV